MKEPLLDRLFRKRNLYRLLFLFFILLSIIFFPRFLSSPLAKPIFLFFAEKRLNMNLEVEDISLRWFGPQKFKKILFANNQARGSIELLKSGVFFWNLSDVKKTFILENGSFSFPNYGNQKLENVDIFLEKYNLKAKGSTRDQGFFEINGKVFSIRDFDVTVTMKNIPSASLDLLAKTEGIFYKALGDTFSLEGTFLLTNKEGKTSLSLTSPYFSTSFTGDLSNQFATTKEPVRGTFQITKAFSQALLESTPTYFVSQTPLTFLFEPQGFSFPYLPFSVKTLQIAKGKMNPGKIVFENSSSLKTLLTLFKSQSPSSRSVDIWFSPFQFKLENGVLNIRRVDFLINQSIHFCLWGDLHLPGQKLQMHLGIPADTLEVLVPNKTFSREDLIGVPLKGTLKDPKLDLSEILAKIAALKVVENAIPEKGPFRRFFQLFTDNLPQGERPPPAERPFPWE